MKLNWRFITGCAVLLFALLAFTGCTDTTGVVDSIIKKDPRSTVKIGDRVVNAGKLYECKSIDYSYIEPSSLAGTFGWVYIRDIKQKKRKRVTICHSQSFRLLIIVCVSCNARWFEIKYHDYGKCLRFSTFNSTRFHNGPIFVDLPN